MTMKKFLLIGLYVLAINFSGCISSKKVQTTGNLHADQIKYFPDAFKNLYFGMPLTEFQKIKPDVKIPSDQIMSFRTEIVENNVSSIIDNVTYYFDNDGNKPLYELIIEYKNETDRNKEADQLLGRPNNGDEWKFDSKEGFDIKAWKFERKLVIIGALPKTEWTE